MLQFDFNFASIFVTFYPDSRVGGHSKLDTCFEGEDTITPAMLIKSLGEVFSSGWKHGGIGTPPQWWDWKHGGIGNPLKNADFKDHVLLVNHGDRWRRGA